MKTYTYGLSNVHTGTTETYTMLAESDEQALANLLEACSESSLSPLFLEDLKSRKQIWESKTYQVPILTEGVSIPLEKGERVAFEWKQGTSVYPVTGTIKKIYKDWRSTNPAQKYIYRIVLDKPVTITIAPGKSLAVKRTSMKNIRKLF